VDIARVDELRTIYRPPGRGALDKQIDHLDPSCVAFLAHAPFVVIATADADGRCDVSPKGGPPGFVKPLDEHRLAIPDLSGNNRLDSLTNLVSSPGVGLLFMIPGIDETLRVNGTAIVVRDDELLDGLVVDGGRPNAAIVVTVEECFFHCPKAFLRGKIWNPASFLTRAALPSLARMILDQTRPVGRSDAEHERLVAEREAASVESNKCLY